MTLSPRIGIATRTSKSGSRAFCTRWPGPQGSNRCIVWSMERALGHLVLTFALSGCLEIGEAEDPKKSSGDASGVGGGTWSGGTGGASGGDGGVVVGGSGGTSGSDGGGGGASGGNGGQGGSGGCGLEFAACSSSNECCNGKACQGNECCTVSSLLVSCKSPLECCTGDRCQDVQGHGNTCCASRGSSCGDALCCGTDQCDAVTTKCCATLSGPCSSDQECCAGLACEGSKCCNEIGTPCNNGAQCCGLALCVDGQCQ